jgi:hypothetical protein
VSVYCGGETLHNKKDYNKFFSTLTAELYSKLNLKNLSRPATSVYAEENLVLLSQ